MHAHVRDIGGAKGMRSGERTAWAGTCQSVSLPAASSAVAVKTVVTGVPGRRSTGLLETATMTLSAAPPALTPTPTPTPTRTPWSGSPPVGVSWCGTGEKNPQTNGVQRQRLVSIDCMIMINGMINVMRI